MALGLTSKILVFVLIMNSVVAFAGMQGMLGNEVNWKDSKALLDEFQSNSANATADIEEDSGSGITSLDFFDPLKAVWNWINMIIDFFKNPIALAWTLPIPLNWIFGVVVSGLEGAAIVGIVRGVTV